MYVHIGFDEVHMTTHPVAIFIIWKVFNFYVNRMY